jgi:sensor c-di-GMP phosphodiesterase-like protein
MPLEWRDNMIERVHEHIIAELQQNTRTDTIFILTAVILNLLTLAINSAIANTSRSKTNVFIAMFIFVSLTVVVNLVVISGMLKGKQTRTKLLNGLMKMYKDQGVEGYYDPVILLNYNARYNLFILTVVCLGLIAIVVPFVIR